MVKTALMLDKVVPSAKILDGVLVLTLPDAVCPVVWQMELGQTKSSAIEVRDQGEGSYMLTLKTPRQDVVDIAAYDARDKAVRALLTLSKALETAYGQLRPHAANSNQYLPAVIPQTENGRLKLVRVGIGLVVIAALIFFVGNLSPVPPSSLSPAAGPVAAEAPTGESQSADDFLNSQ